MRKAAVCTRRQISLEDYLAYRPTSVRTARMKSVMVMSNFLSLPVTTHHLLSLAKSLTSHRHLPRLSDCASPLPATPTERPMKNFENARAASSSKPSVKFL